MFLSPAPPYPSQCWLQSSLSLYDTCYMVVECYVFDSAVLTASTSVWCTMVYVKQFTTEWNRKVCGKVLSNESVSLLASFLRFCVSLIFRQLIIYYISFPF